ncbi:DNA adenine methyltransferase YhdJ [Poriferisphaera corsica]|uniref:Methyltransferase n=1 Tax=Poriferisphaera corsica TaxID=2528020 RepID=A0A517YY55_9BACT|nr:site-specific DNA-methyltransferase [Poriferisphaera corsica]QDU35154.1 DNA adenine methyltransferase YhdJ [Poriferisphaera corsica]
MSTDSQQPSVGKAPRNRLFQGDCHKIMSRWQPNSLDLIFADPPYNIGYNYDHYDDNREHDDYVAWTESWIDACTRLLKPTGSMYILIGDEYAAETRLHLRKLENEGKLMFRNWIIWHYTFGQRCKIKFNRSHAHLFYCVGTAALNAKNLTKKPPFAFNRDAIALPSARMTTYGDKRANPAGKLPDDTWYLRHFPDAALWHTRPQDATENTDEYFAPDSDTWNQSRLCGTFHERTTWHPCQLPEALLHRIIKVSSNPGDLVFDPFTGSGTTLAAAKQLGRDYLGTELSKDYAKKARQRIKKTDVDPNAITTTITATNKVARQPALT